MGNTRVTAARPSLPGAGRAPDETGELEVQAARPWHDVPIFEGRDLASDELWDLSRALSRAKREVAMDPLRLPKARRASVSLILAAVAAATPALASAHSRSSKASESAEVFERSALERGDRGLAVERLQRALGITADGIFGRQTLKAVRAFQESAALAVDGIVGPRTLAALANRSSDPEEEQSHEPAPAAETPSDIDGRLGGALALARELGLNLISAHRPGAIIESSGQPSDHGVFPSKAIDVQGSPAEMESYARRVAGMKGVDTVIYAGVGIWTAGSGWHEIRSAVTHDSHLDHVHVDTF